MSRGVNKVILVGHVGQAPEVRYTPTGTSVCNFSIATNRSWTDQQGVRQEQTEWHRVVMFDKLADIAKQYLQKGAQIYVEGRLRTNEWEKDGVKRYTTEIICQEMQMLGQRQGGVGQRQGGGGMPDANASNGGFARQPAAAAQPANATAKPATANKEPASFDDLDDEVPF